MVALQISPKIESWYGLGRQATKLCKGLYGILQLLQGSQLGWVAFYSLTLTLHSKCLDFQCNQCKKLAPVLARFINWLRHLGLGIHRGQTSEHAREIAWGLVRESFDSKKPCIAHCRNVRALGRVSYID